MEKKTDSQRINDLEASIALLIQAMEGMQEIIEAQHMDAVRIASAVAVADVDKKIEFVARHIGVGLVPA